MELTSTRKKTAIGAIPSDWDVDSVVNLASITTGGKNTQDREEYGAYPFFVRSQTVERINSYCFDGEGVLTAGDGVGTGKIYHYVRGKCDIHQRVYLISDFRERLDGYFFYWYFSNNFFARIMQMTAKSSVDSVRREMIADMQIPVPPAAEQRAIATALSDVDALLSALGQLIAKKRDLKQAAMQRLLTGNERLPGFEGAWALKRLGDESALITKGTTPTSLGKDFKTGGVNFIKVESMTPNGEFVNDKFGFIDDETHSLLKRSQLQDRDLLISIAGALGRVGVVTNAVLPANTNQAFSIVRLKLNAEISGEFLFHSLRTERIKKHFAGISSQGAQANLSLQNIADLTIACPPLPEQTAIATVLSDMDAELAALQARLAKTNALKQGMMQELLTGRTRLL